jgi:hypothetical protein
VSWIWTVAGIVLILVGLNEVFHTLLHPTSRGRMTHLVANTTWRLSSGLGRRGRSVAGPLATVAVVALWAGIQIVGWTLVYLPHVPADFEYGPGVRPESYPHVVEAFYFSVVNMSTLGLGDVYPVELWLRLFAPLQALIGFALLSAAVAWFVELYPGLGRRRAFAMRIALMEQVDMARYLPEMTPATASALLDTLTADLAQAHVDLWQNAESYYFTEDDPDTSLAAKLPYALVMARHARRSPDRIVRNSGQMLEAGIDAFARILRARFIRIGDGTDEILEVYARQHRQQPTAPDELPEWPAGDP